MATTRLIALHCGKGKNVAYSLSEKLDYAHNPVKTEKGELISAYACVPNMAAKDFMLSKQIYLQKVGNEHNNAIIAYQIRQSFKPGEITPTEANRLGYELALKFTKGNHAFTVSTHTDRKHIHNHVIFNSTTINGLSKFENFYYSAIFLQKMNDTICLENGYSIIEKKPYKDREKRTVYPKRHTKRDYICMVIDDILKQKPTGFDDFLSKLSAKGYEIKQGKTNERGEYKHISLKGNGQDKFIRLDSIKGYTPKDIKNKINSIIEIENNKKIKSHKSEYDIKDITDNLDMNTIKNLKSIIDLNNLSVKKQNIDNNKALEFWAKKENLKTAAKTLFILNELGLNNYNELELLIDKYIDNSTLLNEQLNIKISKLEELNKNRNYIFQYTKTIDYYQKYKKLKGINKEDFYELHREKIEKHKQSKKFFESFQSQKIPTIKELTEEIKILTEEIKPLKESNMKINKVKKGLLTIKNNIDNILKEEFIDNKNTRNEIER